MHTKFGIQRTCAWPPIALPLRETWLSQLTPQEVFLRQRDYTDLCWLDNASVGQASCLPVDRRDACPTASQANPNWSYLAKCPVERFILDAAPLRSRLGSLQRLCRRYRTPPSEDERMPPFSGGWIGCLAYDCGKIKAPAQVRDLAFPLISLSLFDTVLAYNQSKKSWWGAATLLTSASARERELEARLKIKHLLEELAPGPFSAPPPASAPRAASSNFSRTQYLRATEKTLEYIAAGDIYQLNLAQRFTAPWAETPAQLYWQLRRQSPAAYGAFLGAGLLGGNQALCSISPELFLSLRGGTVVTRPIKGTRPRGPTPAHTTAAKIELAASAKERAELNMIVDLERNDLGRVCEYGSVEVVSDGEIEELPTLLHRVATVKGRLHPRFGWPELLQAAFPGGSITGAPKIRAMQLIDELEPTARGPYCGAIGWLGLDGSLELSIAIRTALYDGARQLVHYHAGSGIVADSDPAAEYEETLHKAAAFFRAINATLSPVGRGPA